MADAVKLSSPATGEFWEIPVLFEDEHLLALDKPPGLLVFPDRNEPERSNLLQLLHQGIEKGAPWARQRGVGYLMAAHRLEGGTSGVILLARNKPALIALAAQFATDEPRRTYVALVRGSPAEDTFATDAKLAPHPLQMGVIAVDMKRGMRSRTAFTVRERFKGFVLLECRPVPGRLRQIHAHLKHLRLPLVGDPMYGGPPLLLSTLKGDYHLKRGREERPLIGRGALHAEQITIDHPVTGAKMTVQAPWSKDLTVSIKYLRRYAV